MAAARKRLPPLNLLRAFDAAGRHLSFKRAAEELNVTSSTISHQIKSLEDYLGLELFQRGVRQVRLTPDGQAFLEHVSRGFASLRAGHQLLQERRARPQLRISANPFMAAEILIPLIADFRQQFPGIGLSIEATESISERLGDDIHYALRFGHGQWPGLQAQRLFDTVALVVCPSGIVGQTPGLDELKKLPLVDYAYRQDSAWANWQQQLGRGQLVPANPESVTVENFHAAMQAVRKGVGASIGLLPLVQPWLASQAVVAVEDSQVTLEEGLYLAWSATRDPEAACPGVRQWLADQLTQLMS